jgi:protein tyrosine/serine phosphatase
MSSIFLVTTILSLLISNSLFSSDNEIHINGIKKFIDNFHAVEAGALYRSSQLKPNRLKKYIKKLGIKTIINLRGINPTRHWWQREKRLAKEFGIKFYNIPFNAGTFSSKKNLYKLLYLYEHAPKPILIHCRDGADRSGEAAALWILEHQGKGKKEALKHLSIKYGYVKFYRPAKYSLIKMWQGKKWLAKNYNPERL